MTTPKPTHNVHDFEELPEPARSKAVEIFQSLIDDGRSEEEADEQARQLVHSWLSERVPTSTEANGS